MYIFPSAGGDDDIVDSDDNAGGKGPNPTGAPTAIAQSMLMTKSNELGHKIAKER